MFRRAGNVVHEFGRLLPQSPSELRYKILREPSRPKAGSK